MLAVLGHIERLHFGDNLTQLIFDLLKRQSETQRLRKTHCIHSWRIKNKLRKETVMYINVQIYISQSA